MTKSPARTALIPCIVQELNKINRLYKTFTLRQLRYIQGLIGVFLPQISHISGLSFAPQSVSALDSLPAAWHDEFVADASATGFSRLNTKTGKPSVNDGIFMPAIHHCADLWCGGGGSLRACWFLCAGLLTPTITPPYRIAAIAWLTLHKEVQS